MSNIVKKNGAAPQTKPDDSILLEMVKRTDIDPDRLEKFMDLQFKMEAKQAEREFNAALSAFQGECPIIDKSKNVSFKSVNYDYSPIEEIAFVIKPILTKHGLSYSFNIKETGDKDKLELITKIRHSSGHCEETSYYFNKYHDDDRMNLAQRAKSSITFSKRAALENALGLITAKEDDDAGGAATGYVDVTPDQISEIKALIIETKSDEARFLKFIGAENLDNLTAKQAKTAIHALKQKRGTNV
jgi:ERF superfamily